MSTEPSTPDFYAYRWDPVTSAAVRGRFVRLTWADGVELDALDYWLWETGVGAGTDPATREGLVDPAELHAGIAVVSAEVSAEGGLDVCFVGVERPVRYHPGWLRHVADDLHRPDGWRPSPSVWTAHSMAEPPTHDGGAILNDDSVLGDWLNDLVRYGIARLRGFGTDLDAIAALASRVGPVRDTNFGPVWDVRADVEMAGADDTNSTANTNLRLGPHTDLPTREVPPGYQFLHCVANTVDGGYSTMTDGAAVVAALEAEHPEHYEALTTLNWVFFNRGPNIDHRWSGPFIEPAQNGHPLTLRAFYPVRGFPDMAPADQPRAYAAMRCFSAMAASDEFQIDYPFAPGDLVGFDNRRILHGRQAFGSNGQRHLRGVYIDHDDLYSTVRVLNRRAGQSHVDP